MAVSDRDPDAIIFDCRPPILPVSIRMSGPQAPCVVSAASLSLAAPPGEVGSEAGVSSTERGAASVSSSVILVLTWRTNFVIFHHCRRRSLHFRNPA